MSARTEYPTLTYVEALIAQNAAQGRTIRDLTAALERSTDTVIRLRRQLREADGLIEWEAQREMAS